MYHLGFRLGLIYWRASELLDKIPGFTEGADEAYDRYLRRNPPEDDV